MKKNRINNLRITSFVVILIMIITKGLSFLRDLKITTVLGASSEADAFNISYILAITLFGFVSSAYSNALMPVASEIYLTDKKKLEKMISNIINISLVGIGIIIILCWIYPAMFVGIISTNTSEETFSLACKVSRIGILSLVFLIQTSTFNIILRIRNINIVQSIGEFIFPIPLLIGIFLGVKSVYILVALTVLGYFLQLCFILIVMKKQKFHYQFIFNLKDENLKRILLLMIPMCISTGLLQINQIIDNRVASSFGIGGITKLALAIKINGLAYTIFATSLMQIIYAKLSKAYAEKNFEKLQIILNQQVKNILLFIIPCTICLITFNEDIVSFLFVRGSFTIYDGITTAHILMGYSIGLIFFVLRDVCNYLFYSSKETKIPALISSISIVINIVLNIVLSKIIGIQGISYATSIAGMFSFCILLITIKKRMKNIKLIKLSEVIHFIIASISMVSIMLISKRIFNQDIWISSIIMIIGFAVFWIVYFCLSLVKFKNSYFIKGKMKY